MQSTGSLPESVDVPNRAIGYMRASPLGGAWVPNTDTLPWRGTAAGYGFDVQRQGPLRSYGHGGGAPGMNGELRIFPQLGYVVVSLSNLDPSAASELVEFFTLRMPDR
jgi:D-alanyl-D-alanine carboxypeptidase